MSRTRPFSLPELSERSAEDIASVRTQLAQIEAIRKNWAPAIVASGLFSDLQTNALNALATSDPRDQEMDKHLDAFFRQPGVDAPIPNPLPDDPTYTSYASDVAASRAFLWGDAGFLLGVAVGMQLGPHAFAEEATAKRGVR
jgi:hypothetical protein